jgi:hypothetical protein
MILRHIRAQDLIKLSCRPCFLVLLDHAKRTFKKAFESSFSSIEKKSLYFSLERKVPKVQARMILRHMRALALI